jgi:hypothetical protein
MLRFRRDVRSETVVIQFADARRKITRIAKRLRHALLRRNGLPKDLGVGQNAGAVGI